MCYFFHCLSSVTKSKALYSVLCTVGVTIALWSVVVFSPLCYEDRQARVFLRQLLLLMLHGRDRGK